MAQRKRIYVVPDRNKDSSSLYIVLWEMKAGEGGANCVNNLIVNQKGKVPNSCNALCVSTEATATEPFSGQIDFRSTSNMVFWYGQRESTYWTHISLIRGLRYNWDERNDSYSTKDERIECNGANSAQMCFVYFDTRVLSVIRGFVAKIICLSRKWVVRLLFFLFFFRYVKLCHIELLMV